MYFLTTDQIIKLQSMEATAKQAERALIETKKTNKISKWAIGISASVAILGIIVSSLLTLWGLDFQKEANEIADKQGIQDGIFEEIRNENDKYRNEMLNIANIIAEERKALEEDIRDIEAERKKIEEDSNNILSEMKKLEAEANEIQAVQTELAIDANKIQASQSKLLGESNVIQGTQAGFSEAANRIQEVQSGIMETQADISKIIGETQYEPIFEVYMHRLDSDKENKTGKYQITIENTSQNKLVSMDVSVGVLLCAGDKYVRIDNVSNLIQITEPEKNSPELKAIKSDWEEYVKTRNTKQVRFLSIDFGKISDQIPNADLSPLTNVIYYNNTNTDIRVIPVVEISYKTRADALDKAVTVSEKALVYRLDFSGAVELIENAAFSPVMSKYNSEEYKKITDAYNKTRPAWKVERDELNDRINDLLRGIK